MNLEYWDIFFTVVFVAIGVCWVATWIRARRQLVYPRGVIKWYALCAVLSTITSVIRLKIAQALEKANMFPFYFLLVIDIIACMCVFYLFLDARQDDKDSKQK